MKQYSKLFSLLVLGSTATVALADCCSNNNNGSNCVIPFIQWRSQGRNMARKLEGTTSYAVYQGDMDERYGTFNIYIEYDQTFRGHQIAQCLFGDTLVNSPVTTNNNCSNSCNSSAIIISGLGANGLGTGRAATERVFLIQEKRGNQFGYYQKAIAGNPTVFWRSVETVAKQV